MGPVRLRAGLFVATMLALAFVACGAGKKKLAGESDESFDASVPEASLFADASGTASTTCAARTCAELGAGCGPQGDGCGRVIDCGTCPTGQSCGAAGPSQCGAPKACTPKKCADLDAGCGGQGDGCGGIIGCGVCLPPAFCGGGGPSQCGADDAGPCRPATCASLGKNCGPVADGCGALLQCGTCPSGQVCGVGAPNVCGPPVGDGGACVPATCASLGATCGQVGDGCGGLTPPCGTCTSPEVCGGGGFSRCGIGDASVPDASCDGGLCATVPVCDAGGTTTLVGHVWAPSGPTGKYGALPIAGAVVYVPTKAVDAFAPGVSCDRCGAPVSGAPLVSTVSASDGSFVLKNVPAGASVPLVVQLGRWRRQVTIPSVTPCAKNDLDGELTRLPRNKGEGDIPLFAISTGAVDAIECVLRKVGVDDAEFTTSSGEGRVRLYRNNGASAAAPTQPPPKTAVDLVGAQDELDQYDAVVFSCIGFPQEQLAADRERVVAYADKGGRVFGTHYSYVWIHTQPPWDATAVWASPVVNGASSVIDTSTTKGQRFASWLEVVGALLTTYPPTVVINGANNVRGPIAAGAERWISRGTDPNATMLQYAFNTPWAAADDDKCGRVTFADYHVSTASAGTFPQSCTPDALMPREKVLAYALFDLTTCVSTAASATLPGCVPATCTSLGYACGRTSDGCGGVLDCGVCAPSEICGGFGKPFQCTASCTPKDCAAQGIECGPAGDGCGGALDCGGCKAPAVCGLGGPSRCGVQHACAATTCAAAGARCGRLADGCGKLLDCGACPAGETCVDGSCVALTCVPRTCAAAGAECGPIGDGCGALVDCGACPPGKVCGANGAPSKCGVVGAR